MIRLEGSPSGIAAPTLRQRRRLADTLTTFADEQWAHPSRCAGWSNRDVIVHLDSTNTFWAFSISAGLRGEPTRFLSTFDPVARRPNSWPHPRDLPAGEVLDRFLASNEALADLLMALDDEQWSATAEAPPGHLSVSAVAHHALVGLVDSRARHPRTAGRARRPAGRRGHREPELRGGARAGSRAEPGVRPLRSRRPRRHPARRVHRRGGR